MAEDRDLLVGLDIGDHAVKLIQLRPDRSGFSLERLGLANLGEGVMRAGAIENEETLLRTLQELFEQERVEKKRVAVSLSGSGVAIRIVWVPEIDTQEMEALIAWEGEQYLPFPLEEANLDYLIQSETVEDGQRWFQVLLAGARKRCIDQLRRVLERADLTPIVMEPVPLALENSFEASGAWEEGESALLLDIGSQMTYAHAVGGGLSLLTQSFPLGGVDYTRAIQEALSLDYEKAEETKRGHNPDHSMDTLKEHIDPVTGRLVADLNRFLSLCKAEWPDFPIRTVILSGGGGRLAGLAVDMGNELEIPVEVANPFARVSFSDQEFDPDFVASMAPLSVVAMGLGIRTDEE